MHQCSTNTGVKSIGSQMKQVLRNKKNYLNTKNEMSEKNQMKNHTYVLILQKKRVFFIFSNSNYFVQVERMNDKRESKKKNVCDLPFLERMLKNMVRATENSYKGWRCIGFRTLSMVNC